MLGEWGKWQKTVWQSLAEEFARHMNPTLALIVEKNWADIQAVANIVGWDRARQMIPHLINVLNTIEASRQAEGKKP